MPEAPTSVIKQDETKEQFSIEPVEDLPSEFKVKGYEMLDRVVKKSGNSGRVYLPKDWIGARVKIIRSSLIEKDEEKAR